MLILSTAKIPFEKILSGKVHLVISGLHKYAFNAAKILCTLEQSHRKTSVLELFSQLCVRAGGGGDFKIRWQLRSPWRKINGIQSGQNKNLLSTVRLSSFANRRGRTLRDIFDLCLDSGEYIIEYTTDWKFMQTGYQSAGTPEKPNVHVH